MKNKYNKFHNYELNAPKTTHTAYDYNETVIEYSSDSIMAALFDGLKSPSYSKPTYVSQFFVLPFDEKSGEQMFKFRIYDQYDFQIETKHVKESFLLYHSLSNQLVDATLISDAELKEALKDYGDFGWLEVSQRLKDKDNYSFALDLNTSSYDTLGYIDIYPRDNGGYILEKCDDSFYVSELHEIEKLLSIFYGSDFSLNFRRIFVKWVRYEVTIPHIEIANLSDLKETVRTLKYLLEKVNEQVKRD